MKHNIAVVAVTCLVIGTGIGAGAVALIHPQPSTAAIDNAQKQLRVTAKAEERPSRPPIQLQGKLSARDTANILPVGTGNLIVTRTKLNPGELVSAGTLLGEVDNHPVFGIPRDVPLFRDLAPHAEGSDVEAFQRYLENLGYYSGKPSGKVDSATSRAIEGLYAAHGYHPAKPAGFPLHDAAFIPDGNHPAVYVPAVGAELTKEKALVIIEVAGPSISTRVDMLQINSIPIGTHMKASVGGKSGDCVATSKSEYKEAGDSKPAGYDVTFSTPQELAGASPADSVTLIETAPAPKSLAVPLSALRSDGSQHYLMVVENGQDRRVDVVTLTAAQGWAILAPTPAVTVGTEVVVAG